MDKLIVKIELTPALSPNDEILEALKGIVGQFEGDWFEGAIKLGIDSFIVQARAVIARVEGGADGNDSSA